MKKKDKNKIFTRIFAAVLALLMVSGMAVSLIAMLIK